MIRLWQIRCFLKCVNHSVGMCGPVWLQCEHITLTVFTLSKATDKIDNRVKIYGFIKCVLKYCRQKTTNYVDHLISKCDVITISQFHVAVNVMLFELNSTEDDI